MDTPLVTPRIQLKRDEIFSTNKVLIEHATFTLYKEIQLCAVGQLNSVLESASTLELLLSTADPGVVHVRIHEKLAILYRDLDDILHRRDKLLTTQHRSLMMTLQSLVDVLDLCKRETSLIQQKSTGLFGAAGRIRKHLRQPLLSKNMESLKQILEVFTRVLATLKPLFAAMKLVVDLENAFLEKSTRLQQETEAVEQKLTFLEATRKPPYVLIAKYFPCKT
jgi:hypothetical protein